MRIIADENIFEPIIDFLKDEGYEVSSIRTSEKWDGSIYGRNEIVGQASRLS